MKTTTTRQLDALFVNPGGRTRTYQALASTLTAVEPPIWAGLMAGFIRRKGYSVGILDANTDNLSSEEAAEAIADMNPRLAVIVVYGHNPSASTQVMPHAGAICTALKARAPELRTMLVGGHVAALPERTLYEEHATFVAGGEGLYTIADLLSVLKSGSSDYSAVRGLWYRDDADIRSNHAAPLVMDLDVEMPGLAWDLLPMDRYRAHNWHCFGDLDRQPYAALYTTLGCPFHCSFCCIQSPFRDGEKRLGYKAGVSSYRFWSPQAVIDQIDLLVNRYHVRNIKFADELFAANPSHVMGICDLIISRGYDLNIWAYARVDTLRLPMLEKMKKAGINWLGLGIESANARVRTDVHRDYTQERIFEAIEQIRGEGICVGANYIFGLPEDDHASMQQTLNLALEINSEWANFYCAMAYPGSPLYEQALREGWALPRTWDGYSQYAVDALPLPTKYLSSDEVLQFRDHAFGIYFSAQSYLDMIERKFGEGTIHHIREMTARKLDRKYRESVAGCTPKKREEPNGGA